MVNNKKLVSLAEKVINTREKDFNFQINTGAKIRGILGVEKGNQFIKDLSKYSR